jgi:hypothetical protein
MATQEFYIRNASETEARGPFTQEHLISLAENGQVTPDSLYYEAMSEQWTTFASNAELAAVIFPERQTLKLKAKEGIKSLNTQNYNSSAITVDDMLAAAEGRTSDTKSKRDPALARERAAAVGLYTAILLLIISAAALILPSIDVISTGDAATLLQHPLALLGCIHVFLALLLMLQVTQAYPFVRFIVALGIGFVGFILWTQGQMVPFIAFAAGSVGLYFCTVFVNFFGIGLSAGLGLAGMMGYAYYALV